MVPCPERGINRDDIEDIFLIFGLLDTYLLAPIERRCRTYLATPRMDPHGHRNDGPDEAS